MEVLITHSLTLFDDQSNLTSYASSPPLPPAPLGETSPPFPYGSAHTKVSEFGPQQQINTLLSQTPIPQSSTSDDFTPQFTPRPPASIHPSSRGNSGSTNGLSNTSSTRTEAETSPTTFISAPPLPLRPGRQGALTPIQSLRGTTGLDFSHQEIGEGDRTGPAPTSPPLSDPPPTPPPSSFKAPHIPPPPPSSALPQSTFTLQQQQQIALSHQRQALDQAQVQEQPQPKEQLAPPLPTIERSAAGGFDSIAGPFESFSSSKVDDGHSTDHASPITPDAPTAPTPQSATSEPLTQRELQSPVQLRTQSQVPIKGAQVQEQSQTSPVYSLRQPDEIPQGRRESQDLPPSQLQ